MYKHLILATFTICLAFAASATMAQEELRDDREIVEREPVGQTTMSELTYKRLSAIHELMGEDKAQNAEALKRAQELLTSSRLNAYEQALVYQTIGFIHAGESRIGPAIENFEKSIGLNALPTDAQKGMLYSLASLYMSERKFRKAIETAREWFKYEPAPTGDAYMLIGSSYAQLEEYTNALPYVKKAIEIADEPREPWYQLQLAIYFEEKQIASAVPLLQKMIQYWPDKASYWETLYGAHMQLKQDEAALSTLMVAYHKGLLEKEDKLINLVRLNMFLDIPYTAGDILAKEMSAGRIERTVKNLELLRSAWSGAQEFDKALGIMGELGDKTGDPKYAIDQAKVYNELAQWQNVIQSAEKALQQGYDKPGEAYLLIGTAYSETGQYQRALSAFRSAAETGTQEQRNNAKSWIAFVNDRLSMNAPVAANNG